MAEGTLHLAARWRDGRDRVRRQDPGLCHGRHRVLARNDFRAANPAAAKPFEEAGIDINDISAENRLIADGEDKSEDIDKHVSDWIAALRGLYDGWLADTRKAAE